MMPGDNSWRSFSSLFPWTPTLPFPSVMTDELCACFLLSLQCILVSQGISLSFHTSLLPQLPHDVSGVRGFLWKDCRKGDTDLARCVPMCCPHLSRLSPFFLLSYKAFIKLHPFPTPYKSTCLYPVSGAARLFQRTQSLVICCPYWCPQPPLLDNRCLLGRIFLLQSVVSSEPGLVRSFLERTWMDEPQWMRPCSVVVVESLCSGVQPPWVLSQGCCLLAVCLWRMM